MAIKDNRLKEFFSKQKVGAFDSLLSKGAPKEIKPANEEANIAKSIPLDAPSTPKSVAKRVSTDTKQDVPAVVSNKTESVKLSKINPLAIREQTVSNPLAIREQTVSDPLAIREQTVSDPLADPLANPLANADEILVTDLLVFSKKERELLSLVFCQCRNNGALISPPISTEEIRNNLKISPERVRNLIHRLIKKGGLKIVLHRSGQSAYRLFELPKSVYQLMIDDDHHLVRKFIDPLAHPLADPLANFAYSSSNYKNTTTSLPEDWKKINFEILCGIGFSETQLRQLYESNMTEPLVVQDSIDRFAFSLEHSEKVKAYNDPLNVLMGVLRKGQRWIEPNYVSPKEVALRQVLEDKRKQKEERDVLIKELVELEFPEWKRKLSDDEIRAILPDDIRKTNLSAAINATLRIYFVEKILLPKLEMNDEKIK